MLSGNFEGHPDKNEEDVFGTQKKRGNDKQFERKPIILHTKNFEQEEKTLRVSHQKET